ncbi:hypothetical protein CD32_00405 [Lysinibacillus odysseyi 34hs-1 = NBRC 100172]|uniref:DUF2071 domain-containing protein n=2 Tax=Lysinibacillus odysseyi TaxID=202611 RepID=A0A0A3JQT6_9BACI|nr:hypothetical protein CD32_00405 [Lysinibacillus odysseyi 34hs-1 = NBRC 100172]
MGRDSKMKRDLWDESHRPWPLPDIPWTMRQTWSNLLFAHYPIQYEELRKVVPKALDLNTYDGMCWIGVVPFQMSGVRLRGLPPLPGTSAFPELNIRTYVTVDGKPGVYFFSLDAANHLAVIGARTLYRLPYWFADMKIRDRGNMIEFNSRRRSNRDIRFACTYQPASKPFRPDSGSFEEWIVERYCFYTLNASGVPFRCDILHEPWTLQQAEVDFMHNTMLSEQGIVLESEEPILHFAKQIEVRAWPLVDPVTNQIRI